MISHILSQECHSKQQEIIQTHSRVVSFVYRYTVFKSSYPNRFLFSRFDRYYLVFLRKDIYSKEDARRVKKLVIDT